ncbi:MAG: c-type cytochrome biogenesis protein CcmI [Alphaproteobacteria bacterium]|nr:MAG: c-type cytochrome biogenesis protein CcmI [Alphaproteobacteria bacterium]
MTLWLLLTALTALAAVALAWPFLRRFVTPAGDLAREVALARRQMAELDREVEAGALSEEEAAAARSEIERRLLALAKTPADTPKDASPAQRNLTMAILLGWVVVGGVALYAVTGRPELGSAPFRGAIPLAGGAMPAGAALPAVDQATRAATDTMATTSVDDAIAGLAARLADNPDDADGWRMLGWSYFNTERYREASEAYAKAVAIRGDDPELLSLYGETLVRAADGRVTDKAREVFDRVLALDPNDARARFFKGMALEQDGDPKAAVDAWLALLDSAPAGADWAPGVEERVRELAAANNIDISGRLAERTGGLAGGNLLPPPSAAAPGPTAEDVAAAGQMTAEDRQAMIRGMVDRLAARLAEDPNDPDGWVRLIRSRLVLGEPEKAGEALRSAQAAFASDPATRARIEAAAREMGVRAE